MIRSLALAVFLSASVATAQDAGPADAGSVADAGAAVVAMPAVAIVGVTDAGITIEVSTPVVTVTQPEPNIDIKFVVDSAKAIHDAVKNKAWGRLIFLIITVLVIFCRKVLAPKIAFFRGKFGAPLLAFFWAGAGALGTTWPAGTKLDAQDLFMALEAGVLAAGGWSLLKNTLEHFYPKDGTTNWATVIATVVGALAPAPADAPKPPEAPKPVA